MADSWLYKETAARRWVAIDHPWPIRQKKTSCAISARQRPNRRPVTRLNLNNVDSFPRPGMENYPRSWARAQAHSSLLPVRPLTDKLFRNGPWLPPTRLTWLCTVCDASMTGSPTVGANRPVPPSALAGQFHRQSEALSQQARPLAVSGAERGRSAGEANVVQPASPPSTPPNSSQPLERTGVPMAR